MSKHQHVELVQNVDNWGTCMTVQTIQETGQGARNRCESVLQTVENRHLFSGPKLAGLFVLFACWSLSNCSFLLTCLPSSSQDECEQLLYYIIYSLPNSPVRNRVTIFRICCTDGSYQTPKFSNFVIIANYD